VEATIRVPYEPGDPASRIGGLGDARFHVDACGIGLVADLSGRPSNAIVRDGLEILGNLAHRGAAGADESSGDGAGLLLSIPDAFFRDVMADAGVDLPPRGAYAVAMVFLTRDRRRRLAAEISLEGAVAERGHTLLGWRDVPTVTGALGQTAREKEPVVRQLFVQRGAHLADADAFERDLYLARKISADHAIRTGLRIPEDLYVVSFSARTITYKGLLLAHQAERYYPDLVDRRLASAVVLVHQRFSTNTFPEWHLAQPFRFIGHNGEINTLQGNVGALRARSPLLASQLWGRDASRLRPIVLPGASDSAAFDNVLELLVRSGRSLPHAVRMMVPPAWENDPGLDPDVRAFYAYHAALQEPWDGPAAMVFTDGRLAGAVLDRNGLRPARWLRTTDGRIVIASEVGVLGLPDDRVVQKERLNPGQMLLIDLEQGRILDDGQVERALASRRPYAAWVREHRLRLSDLPAAQPSPCVEGERLLRLQRTFGYTAEEVRLLIEPMAKDGSEAVGSMGNDSTPAVLSERPRLLPEYFKQHFAQVSNPPIDPLREGLVMSLTTRLGCEGSLLEEQPEQAAMLELAGPLLSDAELARVASLDRPRLRARVLPLTWTLGRGVAGLREAVEQVARSARQAVEEGFTILVLSDRGVDATSLPIPPLLGVAAVHHHLLRSGVRKRCSLVVDSGEPREVMHVAVLLGYGASAVCPWLLDATVAALPLPGLAPDQAVARCHDALTRGVAKVMSKMGISTLQGYQGAQVFEALGLSQDLVDVVFTGTVTRIGGAGFDVIAEEVRLRHEAAHSSLSAALPDLDGGGEYAWRAEGEAHLWTPMAVAELQRAVRSDDPAAFQRFAAEADRRSRRAAALRGLLEPVEAPEAVPLDEVEPVEAIVRRFKGGAMSLGSISSEAHEAIAIALNRLGARSNTGEGGEAERRWTPDPDGSSRRSAIKQVASARFGVTAAYLANADELQIKMAQGAKPGEGGQLPGHKVTAEIAAVRHSTPGVGLISPPPHHDIYSIEDLAQLIHDLRNANPRARIGVKLVSEAGVGTVAAGVAKARADVVLISGYEGGTGASPWSAIKHTGLPWELGLAEAQQVLVENGLRSRVTLEVDGQLKTGLDVVIAALLGAEEFGFATGLLVSLGCTLLRKCHLDTCSAGIATQRPELRARFAGRPEHVERFLRFVAADVRRHLARLGLCSIHDAVGRTDLLRFSSAGGSWKARGLDLAALLERGDRDAPDTRRHTRSQPPLPDDTFDHGLIAEALPALERGESVRVRRAVRNRDRTVGTRLGYEVASRYGSAGLPDGTIRVHLVGSVGQSFGAFLPRGVRLELVGDANDAVGKGLSGGEIVVRPADDAAFRPEDAVVAGNVLLYGATSGRLFVRGRVGERFAVRNSGAEGVVEGCGHHGCEYMTGGRVVVLGPVGRNFAAGMSGGVAYVWQPLAALEGRVNPELVDVQPLAVDADLAAVRTLLEAHARATGSFRAVDLLECWPASAGGFVRVLPREYGRVLAGRTAREGS
jgi:glutamate synthase domain-containing protein 2/glutamate synthase domain-containing protein 1/glutamate synthase domain-containing protein 3